MKGFFKRLCAAALTLTVAAVAFAPTVLAVQLPTLPKDQCVMDTAGVLSDETAQYLDSLNGQLEGACSGAQIGVLTVDYTGSASTEEYALNVFNTWGIGDDKENNGVLILLVMESPLYADGDYYLTYGDGFRNTTLEKQASALAQTMEDSFVAKDYDSAVKTCADAVAGTIADIYGVSLEGEQFQPVQEPSVQEPFIVRFLNDLIHGFLTLVLGLFVLMGIFRIFLSPAGRFVHRAPRPPRGPHYPPPPPPGGFGWLGARPRPPRGGFDPWDGHDRRPGGFDGPRGGGRSRGPHGGGGFSGPRGGGFSGPRGGSGSSGPRGGSGSSGPRSGGGFGGMGGGMSHGGGGGRGR